MKILKHSVAIDPDTEYCFRPGNFKAGFSAEEESGSGMNIPDHISESLETIFWVKILKFFDADRAPGWNKFGSGMVKIRIREKHPGINIPDPQH